LLQTNNHKPLVANEGESENNTYNHEANNFITINASIIGKLHRQ
jgi:hypothetical protein